jgi:hypothetical protein
MNDAFTSRGGRDADGSRDETHGGACVAREGMKALPKIRYHMYAYVRRRSERMHTTLMLRRNLKTLTVREI